MNGSELQKLKSSELASKLEIESYSGMNRQSLSLKL